jgi:DNA-binding protein HU-beta
MTRHELINTLSKETSMSKRDVERVLNQFTEIVGRNIKRGEKVAVTGFGTFDLGKRAARRGINPQTGREIQIPEMKMPRFRAGSRLKEIVR